MKSTGYTDLQELFGALAIGKGDKVMVHGFFPSFGKIDGGYKTFFDALLNVIGDRGTLIIPTFSYTYFKKEVYDVMKSESTIGDFTNFFLENYPCYRNLEPNFSMAAIGPDSKNIISRDNKYVFGRKGIYQKIEEHDVIFLLIGIDWDQGLTYSIHIEHCAGVNYRYDKEFTGMTTNHEGNSYQDSAVHFVRNLEMNPVRFRSRVGRILDEEKISGMVKYNYGIHRSISASNYSEMALKKMEINPNFMLKEINGKAVEI